MEVTKVLHMNGGIGDFSYAKNSLLQEKVILMTKSITNKVISTLYDNLSPRETIRIADLVCSSGPNTFLTISQLIQAIHEECKSNGQQCQSPEIHFFLNDLPSNDFNTIFRSLPTFYEDLRKQNMGGDGLFVTGVPGSFYTRLFPSKTLHFVHSSYSLHWLSQVPDGIESNKGNISVASTSPPSVVKAYYEQYERDFVNFLKYRSKELVDGGCMILTILGRKNEERYSKGACYLLEPMARALRELVVEGSIEEEKVYTFNIPAYYPSLSEVMHIVDKEGSFTIDILKTCELHIDDFDENMAQCVRAFTEPLLVTHFGDNEILMDQVFHKCREIYFNFMTKEKTTFTNVIVSLATILPSNICFFLFYRHAFMKSGSRERKM